MLDKLLKKLHFIFIGSMMLIITLIIIIVCVNSIETEKINDSTFFQRITTHLIYQLENDDQHIESTISDYEEKYSLFCILKGSDKRILYQSDFTFSTRTDTLLELFKKQEMTQKTNHIGTQAVTTQGGIFEIKGTSDDHYWIIPATIISKNDKVYDITLIYQQNTPLELLQKHMPFYILIWLASLFVVVWAARLLLKKAFEPTERILKGQKEFVASASHELKSPLAVILANLDVIDSLNVNDPSIQKSVKTMDAECMRMSRLIKDMLLLASSDAKTWTLNKTKVDIDTLLITLYESYEPICINKGISLKVDVSESSYPVLYTDKERIFEILRIYIDNAIHHAKGCSCIQISTALTFKTITFFVADNGQGVSDEDKSFVFDRFYCADKSHTDKSHFGLGLSIAAELAKMLHAKVGLKDTDGGGATFFLTLPFK